MTHGAVPEEQRQTLGITDSLVRLSVGVEDVRDLIDDLKERARSDLTVGAQALACCCRRLPETLHPFGSKPSVSASCRLCTPAACAPGDPDCAL